MATLERRPFFDDDHLALAESVREFCARHVTEHVEEWDRQGAIPREVWHAAGDLGLLGLTTPDEYGGSGSQDYRFRVAVSEELSRVGATPLSVGFAVSSDLVVPYLADLATPGQAERWLLGLASGRLIGAIAMTEPGAGSDLRGIRTTARRTDSGWLLNGAKTFISNGINADVVIVVARTNTDPDAGSRAFSLFLLPTGTPGFERGRKLDKLGLRAQDTAELSFTDVELGEDALLGEEGRGLHALMEHLPLERLSLAVAGCASVRAALQWTLDHVTERQVFGRPVADLQNTRFVLAEIATELDVTQVFVDDAVLRYNRRELSAVDAAKAKWWATEFQKRAVDRCLQLFGGYGYMLEYPIARAYADTRVATIYGGTTEIMKSIIARDLLGR